MGSEQSSQARQKPLPQGPRPQQLRRGHTVGDSGHRRDSTKRSESLASGNDSPGTSVCSDSDLPYISYMVPRPIGDSPKHTARSRAVKPMPKRPLLHRRQTSLPPNSSSGYAKDIVVVKKANSWTSLDPDIARLQEIPTFLPIMRGTLGLPGARDPDILDGLDFRPLVRLTSSYQNYMKICAQNISTEQNTLTAKSKEVDLEVSRLHSQFVDRQRSNARNAERLSRVRSISHQLARCQSLLNKNIQDIEELNRLLPEDQRLQPFVWQT